MSYLVNPYMVTPVVSSLTWATSGYDAESPPIITNGDLTASSANDLLYGSGFSTGIAISSSAGDLKMTISGDSGVGGSLSNTICGLTDFETPATATLQNMDIGNVHVFACIMFNEGNLARPNNDGSNTISYTSGDVFEIKVVDTTATFYKNGATWSGSTRSIDAGSYYNYIGADNTARTGGSFTFS